MKTAKKSATNTKNMADVPINKNEPIKHTGINESSRRQNAWISNRKFQILVVVLVLVMVGVVGGFFAKNRSTPPPHNDVQTISADDKELLSADLLDTTGIDYSSIANNDITDATYNTYEDAYQAGLTLYANGLYDKALQSFKIAEQKGANDYIFYIDYAAALYATSANEEAIEKLQLAKDAVQKDTTLPDVEKADQLRAIEEKINVI